MQGGATHVQGEEVAVPGRKRGPMLGTSLGTERSCCGQSWMTAARLGVGHRGRDQTGSFGKFEEGLWILF